MRTPTWKPLKLNSVGPFELEVEFLPEDTDPKSDFIGNCGWTEEEYKRIRNFYWFCAKVTASLDGRELGSSYLGLCCHPNKQSVLKSYLGGYLPQMIREATEEATEELKRLLKLVQDASAKLDREEVAS